MPSTFITVGDALSGLSQTAGNDGTLVVQTGPAGGKINALSVDAAGKPTFAKTPIYTDAPVFSAYQSTAQSLANSVITKLQFQTKEFDTGNYYDAVTNFRYTPLVAGYYQVSGSFQITTAQTLCQIYIYKNGGQFKFGTNVTTSGGGFISALVFLNGTTDYIELFGTQGTTAQNTAIGFTSTYFQAVLVKAA